MRKTYNADWVSRDATSPIHGKHQPITIAVGGHDSKQQQEKNINNQSESLDIATNDGTQIGHMIPNTNGPREKCK